MTADLGSARASRAGDRALAIANSRGIRKVTANVPGRFGEGAETSTRGECAPQITPPIRDLAAKCRVIQKAESVFLPRELGSGAVEHCLANSTLHFLTLTAQHCRLIRHAYSFQVHIRIKSRRVRAFKFLEERLFVAATSDIIANVICVPKSQDHNVMSAAVTERAGAGCLRLFVLCLAMNNRSHRFGCVFAYPLPN